MASDITLQLLSKDTALVCSTDLKCKLVSKKSFLNTNSQPEKVINIMSIDEFTETNTDYSGYSTNFKSQFDYDESIKYLECFIRALNSYLVCEDPASTFLSENTEFLEKLKTTDIRVKHEYHNYLVSKLLTFRDFNCIFMTRFLSSLSWLVSFEKRDIYLKSMFEKYCVYYVYIDLDVDTLE